MIELLTIKEAAKAIRMSEGFVRLAIRNKELSVMRLGKVRGVRVTPAALQAFIERKIVVTASSQEQERAALAKMTNSLNQWVTASDR